MVYFLVNNNYQYIDAVEHAKGLDCACSLIQIPHTLDLSQLRNEFQKVYLFETPFRNREYLNPFNVFKVHRDIEEVFHPTDGDILFVYTEFEILNQYFIKYFRSHNAKVYVIEDGGFPTYLTYSVVSDQKLKVKQWLKKFYIRHVLGYKDTRFLFFNNIIFPQIDDKYINGVLLYHDVDIVRKIPKYILTRDHKSIELDNHVGLILNEKVYQYYCTKSEYKEILEDMLFHLQTRLNKIYFKFHPRESSEDIAWQKEIIQKYSNVELIEDKVPIENIIQKYRPEYVFSIISAAMFSLNRSGITPIYIFHLYENFRKQKLFLQVERLLHKMNYSFCTNYNDINIAGFKSGSIKKVSLNMILDESK